MKFKKFADFCFAGLVLILSFAVMFWVLWAYDFVGNFIKNNFETFFLRILVLIFLFIVGIVIGIKGLKKVINDYPLLTRRVDNGDFVAMDDKKKILRKFSGEEIYWKWKLPKKNVFSPSESLIEVKTEFFDGLIIRKINYKFFVVPLELMTIEECQKNYNLIHSKSGQLNLDKQERKIKELLYELEKNKPEIFTSFYNPYDKNQEEDFLKAIKQNLGPNLNQFGLEVYYPYYPKEI